MSKFRRCTKEQEKFEAEEESKQCLDNRDGEDDNDGLKGQSWTNCSSEDEHSNASQELNSKTRASDSQSLYARKRRERISKRLRIVQNLVPNGTKVDMSTMLEEAVQYVKFLQLQIKMLSSDDMWIYAPVAYNGMGIGLDDLHLTKQG